MGFDDVLKKVQSTLSDSTTSGDILEAMREQNQLLARLVAFNEFSMSDTDRTHRIPIDIDIVLPDRVTNFDTLVIPKKLGYEIHITNWCCGQGAGGSPPTGTMRLSLHYGAFAKNNERSFLVYNLRLFTSVYHSTDHVFGNLPIAWIIPEGFDFLATWLKETAVFNPSFGTLNVTGYYYSRKNQPQWISPH